MPAQTNFTETRIAMSDPTALGVFGLSMVTFVAASQKMGWTSGVVVSHTLGLVSRIHRPSLGVIRRLQKEQLFRRDRAGRLRAVLERGRDALGDQPGLVRGCG